MPYKDKENKRIGRYKENAEPKINLWVTQMLDKEMRKAIGLYFFLHN